MYIPNDIWQIIKKFMFKTPEMKEYDIFINNFKLKINIINNLQFPNEPYEEMMYTSWSFAEKYMFIRNYTLYL